jgi:hypothetical protein
MAMCLSVEKNMFPPADRMVVMEVMAAALSLK